MFNNICEECCHLIFENECRCSTGKIIGCMYINMVKGCVHYNTETNKRCKSKVVETENGKLSLCTDHDKTLKDQSNSKIESKPDTEQSQVKSKKHVKSKQIKTKRKIVKI